MVGTQLLETGFTFQTSLLVICSNLLYFARVCEELYEITEIAGYCYVALPPGWCPSEPLAEHQSPAC